MRWGADQWDAVHLQCCEVGGRSVGRSALAVGGSSAAAEAQATVGRRHGVCKSPVDPAWTVPSSSAPSEGVTAGLVSGSCVGSAAPALHGCAVHREWTREYASAVVSIHLPQSAFMRRCFMSLASVAHCTAHRCLPCPWPPPSPPHPLLPPSRTGCYVWLGNGPTEGGCMLHNPK